MENNDNADVTFITFLLKLSEVIIIFVASSEYGPRIAITLLAGIMLHRIKYIF